MTSSTPNKDLLSPSSPRDDDLNNGVDTFPPLTETPAAMSPVPGSTDLGAAGHAEPGHASAGEEEDTWSTESEHEDDYENAVHRMASSGSNPLDSRSIYHALFGGGAAIPSRNAPARTAHKLPELPVYKLALGASDVESSVKLEEACFSKGASKDKITYRIEKGSGLNVGLFTTVYPDSDLTSLATYASSAETAPGLDRRIVLVAHVIATQTTNDRIREDDDALPPSWEQAHTSDHSNLGHKPFGKTIAVHSIAVLPELRHKNIGTCLWKAFTQMIKSSKSYTRIAISVPSNQTAWFKKHKFRVLGPSVLKDEDGHARVDMVIDYSEDDDSEDEDEEGEEEFVMTTGDEVEEVDEDETEAHQTSQETGQEKI